MGHDFYQSKQCEKKKVDELISPFIDTLIIDWLLESLVAEESQTLAGSSFSDLLLLRFSRLNCWTDKTGHPNTLCTLGKLWWAFPTCLRIWALCRGSVGIRSQPASQTQERQVGLTSFHTDRLLWHCCVFLLLSPLCLSQHPAPPPPPIHPPTHAYVHAAHPYPQWVPVCLLRCLLAHSLQWWTPVQTLTLGCLSGKCQNKSCHN